MKISIANRLLLTIYTLVIILISLAILASSIGIAIGALEPASHISGFLVPAHWDWKWIIGSMVISILFLLVSIKLLFSGIKKKATNSTLLKNTELGMIRVSISTLDTMAQRAVQDFEQVKDVKTSIVTEEDGVRVHLKVLAMPDAILPELTSSIQQKVKEHIEKASGILVKEVRIYVDNLSIPHQRPRVE